MITMVGEIIDGNITNFFPMSEDIEFYDDLRICLMSLPVWMDVEWYNLNQTKMTYAYNFDFNPNVYEKEWFFKVFQFDLIKLYSVSQLLKVKNFRSQFRQSLRMQLEDWLDGASNYKSPFSQKQWDMLTRGNEIYGTMDFSFAKNPFIYKSFSIDELTAEFKQKD